MQTSRLIFISLLGLGLVLIFFSGYNLVSKAELDQSQRSKFIQLGEEESLVIVKLFNNNEDLVKNYTISIFLDGRPYRDHNITIPIMPGNKFALYDHVHPRPGDRQIEVLIYDEANPRPISKATYIIQ